MSDYLTTEEWEDEFGLKELWEQIEANLKVFAPKVLEAINELDDNDLKDLERSTVIMIRQWYMDNTEE